MKFTSAALLFFLSGSASAFVPPSKNSRPAFAIAPDAKKRTTLGKTHDFSLASTTVKKELINGLGTQTVPDEFTEILSMSAEEIRASVDAIRTQSADYLSQYEGQTGAAALYTKLQEYGTTVVNGYSGGAVLPVLDQFHLEHPRHKQSGKTPIRWITNSNESSAGHVAEGYAKGAPLTPDGKLPVGVAIATSGPGVTNLITPLQDAICDGVPLVVICGQAATTAPKDAFQFAPAVALTKPCTKWSYQVKSAAEIPFVLDYAFFVARNGRPGPVFIDLPKDLQIQTITKEGIQTFIDNNLTKDSNPEKLARLVTRRREGGGLFEALHFGDAEKGLAFEIQKAGSGELEIKPVVSSLETDEYHKDHHITDNIMFTDVSGEEKRTYIGGVLQHGDPMLKDIVRLVQRAKKPIILAGQGCNDCPDELKEFAETLKIPVTTTLHALGAFDERHPLALNMMGMHGHPTPNFMVQESDLIICIGSRFDDRITGRPSDFIPEARKAAAEGRGGVIHVDIRMSENAAQIEPTYFVHSTGKKFLQTMNAQLRESPTVPKTSVWLEHKRNLQAEFPVKIPKYDPETVEFETLDGEKQTAQRTRMSAQAVISEMNRQLLEAGEMDNSIFTTGVGIHQMVAAQLLTWTKPRQMLSSGSLGTMGVALGYCMGAKLANWAKKVIGIDGDGSFNMTFTELKTVAEQKIPIKLMILDNESQMMVEYWQRLFHDGRYLAVHNSNNPEYRTLAQAFGIRSIYVDCEEELEEKMREFLFEHNDEPVLFHVRIERTPCLPLVAPGQPLNDMILEDLDFEVDKSAAPS
jgi:acetolactate synthase-1/2/3 large subunit